MQSNERKQKRRLTAQEKWQIYQECEQPGAPIGEILRKYRLYRLYSSDLQTIRQAVKQGALEGLERSRPGRRKQESVARQHYDELRRELQEKEKALAELSVLFTTLKKK